MPSPERRLTPGDAVDLICARVQPPPPPLADLFGVELEWWTCPEGERTRRVAPPTIEAVLGELGPLPAGGRVTVEPGGQVELSTCALPSVADMLHAAETDGRVLRAALADAGIVTEFNPLDRVRPPVRVLERPRYEAMEAYFRAEGAAGPTMMCNTSSIHVNVGWGDDVEGRWRAAHVVADVAAELFCSASPRRQIWSAIDRTRTDPVGGTDPGPAWAAYALAARVMFIRVEDATCHPVDGGLTFGEWLRHGHPLGWPTEDDVDEHLTTLFPPVRPRGWLEIRTLDALDDDRWPAAVATVALLIADADARSEVLALGAGPSPAELVPIARRAVRRHGVDVDLDHALGLAAASR